MFSELSHELEEEVVAGDDDPETHYNMGVAFREMGLLDEAIAELQRVSHRDRSRTSIFADHSDLHLAGAVLPRQGSAGRRDSLVRKGSEYSGARQRSRVLAINYELGSACEQAQDKPQALRHFTYVYGANIDYRDVAERIQALTS